MRLPGQDHATDWIDPASDQFILIDEPYRDVPDERERAAWEDRTGWRVIRSDWPGMYNPYACDLYVATDGRTGYDLDALVARINAMPSPTTDSEWRGDSCDNWKIFLSPMARTRQDARRARSRGTIFPVDSATTVPYSYSAGSVRRRPAGEFGIDGHIAAGRLIKGVQQSPLCSWSVFTRLNSVRATLEDWLALEIGRGALDGPEFFEVYYTKTSGDEQMEARAGAVAGVIDMLADLRLALVGAYPDCAPLRRQLRHIESADKAMRPLV